MTPEDFDTLFDTFHSTAVRLESLPAYDVAGYEGSRLTAFRAGQALPVRSVTTDPWLDRIARTSVAGKVWQRVRVVDEPLTDYERFELAVYPETQAVGEDIRIVARPAADHGGPDFWLFDGDTREARAVLMRYNEHGGWLGADLTDDPAVIDGLAERLARAVARSVSLNEFLAANCG